MVHVDQQHALLSKRGSECNRTRRVCQSVPVLDPMVDSVQYPHTWKAWVDRWRFLFLPLLDSRTEYRPEMNITLNQNNVLSQIIHALVFSHFPLGSVDWPGSSVRGGVSPCCQIHSWLHAKGWAVLATLWILEIFCKRQFITLQAGRNPSWRGSFPGWTIEDNTLGNKSSSFKSPCWLFSFTVFSLDYSTVAVLDGDCLHPCNWQWYWSVWVWMFGLLKGVTGPLDYVAR